MYYNKIVVHTHLQSASMQTDCNGRRRTLYHNNMLYYCKVLYTFLCIVVYDGNSSAYGVVLDGERRERESVGEKRIQSIRVSDRRCRDGIIIRVWKWWVTSRVCAEKSTPIKNNPVVMFEYPTINVQISIDKDHRIITIIWDNRLGRRVHNDFVIYADKYK